MKLSESWLREWVNPALTTDALVEQITMAGLEVDSVEPVAGEFTGVVVGEIVSVEQHPDADKLRVCQVAGHPDGVQQVVCGAPNAREGIKVPFAMVGAVLPDNFKIKKAKLRGVESFGMLCAQTELQAGDDDAGLWELPAEAVTGQDLTEYLALRDAIIEVDLTPNRSDCLSIRGLARDVGVLNRVPVSEPSITPVRASVPDTFTVSLEAGEACPRYCGRIIRNVDVTRPSPLWLQEKLRRSGIRSIDAVVDVTNYVMLELGQPLHAFDLNQLDTGIRVRLASSGEKMTLLDGQEVTLKDDTLVIADHQRPLAIAGIMGGENSGVSESTRDVFLESAFFNPLAIAGRARSYGLHTESSHRYERGVDYDLAPLAIERATQLLLDIVGGEAGPVSNVELADHLPEKRQVRLRRERIASGLGLQLPDEEVVDILTRLGFSVVGEDDQSWTLEVPSYRFDVAIEADLLEELARIYGYNRLPTRALGMQIGLQPHSETRVALSQLRRHMISRGYQEAITYSFIDPQLQRLFGAGSRALELLNPISADLAVMRTSLLPGLARALVHNINRQQQRVRLFEAGQRFVVSDDGALSQEPAIAGVIYGSRDEDNWASNKGTVDFFDIKGDLESLLSLTGQPGDFTFKPASSTVLHPGQCADVIFNGEVVGVVGALHPELRKQLDIPKPVFVFEISQSAITQAALPRFKGVSKFPAVSRDMAIVVDRNVHWEDMQKAVREVAGDNLKDLKVFDVYVGEGIDPKRKSLAFSLTFQDPSRTLTEDEVNTSMAQVLACLEEKFNANLR